MEHELARAQENDRAPRTGTPGLRAQADASLEDLLARVRRSGDAQARWELLLEAVVTMAGDLTLDRLLGRIVVIAGALVDARYAALGVLDPTGAQRLRTFVHHGLHEEVVEEIGALPEGHGLLGLIIDRPEPVRLADLAQHPASYGFPAGHPPMGSFLGVPVRSGERVFGNLYLTEKADASEFTDLDERIVVALAAAAGVAIENAELLEETRRRGRWLAASAEITAALLSPGGTEGALDVVADRAREVAGADAVWIVSEEVPGELTVQATSGVQASLDTVRALATAFPASREVMQTGRPLVVDDVLSDPRTSWVHRVPGWPRIGPAVFVPFGARGEQSGALVLGWAPERAPRSRELDLALPSRFAEQAALTLQLERAQETQGRLALFQDRDRIARDLHDVVIQRLFAVGLGLQGASRLIADPQVAERLEQAVDELDGTIRDIRRTIFELGSTDTSTDLRAEVVRMVRRGAATLKFQPRVELDGPIASVVRADVAADLLAVLSEALSNAARHAAASAVDVTVSAGSDLVLEVADDGRGVPDGVAESGLRNVRERAERRGGTCRVGPGHDGRGTVLRWSVPLTV